MDPDPTIIDSLYQEHRALLEYLDERGEISLRATVESISRKTLLLAAASYFESVLKDQLLAFVAERTHMDSPIMHFIKNKAIERQYHTYFDWNTKNANSFFKLFGGEFFEFMKEEARRKPELGQSIAAFVQLGAARNNLVHQNFATFPLDQTLDEIYTMYRTALTFVQLFTVKLGEHDTRRLQEHLEVQAQQ